MTSIVVSPAPIPGDKVRDNLERTDYMPLSTRLRVAHEINRLWDEFATEMHDGPLSGPEVAEKFWKFVTGA